MNLWNKGMGTALIIVTAVTVVSGCGAGEGKESTSGKTSEGEQKNVTLKMVESLSSPARTQLLNDMIQQFQQQNPNIKVELISPPLENADQKIASMLQTKQELDVLEVRDQTVKQFSQNKFISSLQPYTDNWSNWNELIDNAKVNSTVVDNTPYFIPYGIYQKTLFYRKDWFAEKGLQPPKTWEELLNAAEALTDPSKNRYGYSFRGGAGSPDYTEFMTWSYLGDKLNSNDGYFTKDGTPMYATPEAKQAMQMFVDLYKNGSPPDSISWSYPEMVQGFTSGVTAMLIQDPEVIKTAEESMEEGTWDTAPIPLGPSGFAQQTAGTAGWGITSFSKHKEEAWKLIEFLSNPEQNLNFAKNNGLIPIYKSASEDPFFSNGYYKTFLTMNSETDKYLSAQRPISYKGWGAFRGIAEKDIQNVLLNKMKQEDALSKWADYWAEQKKQQ